MTSATVRAQDVADFQQRVFSGYDLLQVFDLEGIGVGASMYLVQRAELEAATRPEIRKLTFAPDLRVKDVQEALTRLMGGVTPRIDETPTSTGRRSRTRYPS